jgi:hypothetical protein
METFEIVLCNLSSWNTDEMVAFLRETITRKVKAGYSPTKFPGADLSILRLVVSDTKKSLTESRWYRGRKSYVTSAGCQSDGSLLVDVFVHHPEHLSNNVTENLMAAAGSIQAPAQMKKDLAVVFGSVIGGGGAYHLMEGFEEFSLGSFRQPKKRNPSQITKARLLEKARRRVQQAQRRVRNARYDLLVGEGHWKAGNKSVSKAAITWQEEGLGATFHGFGGSLSEIEDVLNKKRLVIIEEAARLLEGGQ